MRGRIISSVDARLSPIKSTHTQPQVLLVIALLREYIKQSYDTAVLEERYASFGILRLIFSRSHYGPYFAFSFHLLC